MTGPVIAAPPNRSWVTSSAASQPCSGVSSSSMKTRMSRSAAARSAAFRPAAIPGRGSCTYHTSARPRERTVLRSSRRIVVDDDDPGQRPLEAGLPGQLGEQRCEGRRSLVREHRDRDHLAAEVYLGDSTEPRHTESPVLSPTLHDGAPAQAPSSPVMNELTESLWRTSTRPVGSVRAWGAPERIVVLTFDDGPVPGVDGGPARVDGRVRGVGHVLRRDDAVRRAPGLLAEISAAGHEVALHGPDHVRLTGLPFREIVERHCAARLELEDLVGVPVRWIRPPYGSQSLRSWAAVRQAGLTPVMWGGTTWDWKDVSMEERMAKVESCLAPGQIVLAHDVIAGVEDGADPREHFDLDRGAFIRTLLEAYRAHGYDAVSLAAAMARGASLRRWAWFGR